ncbi:glycosyltransferase family 39 protein [Pedobacter insulae]|uniref:Dolichyl-phosphate-mannose-protein mannosyltransferase n=1 Tax=Pedobacter insulae TaxID=414048 RepID=A0A1I2TN31_9SPHI|nr:glycosyltransferase family 39 protein [Pedobacter insulae]SFG66322.1 Dolichyl-phosphate-mannose-protein mannosyltransferase [Pedobacter insulae]
MKKATLILFAFIITKFILQYLVIHPIYDLQRDEYLHLDQAKHLAWGYHSIPPVTSWISWLILKLGNSYFWVKFFPALFGALTILVVWKTVETLKGSLYACILTAIALTFSSLLRINMLYQPNSLDILSWTLVYFTFIKFIQTEKYKWLYFTAICFAIGFLNKYNIVFCLLGLLPAVLLTTYRKVFTNPKFYLALLIGIILISPNLIWQFQNDFPVFQHMKELSETQLVHVNRMDFVVDQVMFFLSSLLIIIAGFISLFAYKPFKPYRFLFWALSFTLAIFIYLKAKGYYALGLYPIFFSFGAVYLSHLLQHGWKLYLRLIPIAIILLLFIPLLDRALPLKTPEEYFKSGRQHTWEDGKKHPISQDFADMLGWKELAAKVDSLYNTISDKKTVLILCDNYGQAGAINYYTKFKGLIADSFTNDYINWVKLDHKIETVIRIKDVGNTDFTRDYALFKNVIRIGEIDNKFARERGTQIILLTEPKLDLAQLLRKEKAAGNLQ